jgi:hypothetical protein
MEPKVIRLAAQLRWCAARRLIASPPWSSSAAQPRRTTSAVVQLVAGGAMRCVSPQRCDRTRAAGRRDLGPQARPAGEVQAPTERAAQVRWELTAPRPATADELRRHDRLDPAGTQTDRLARSSSTCVNPRLEYVIACTSERAGAKKAVRLRLQANHTLVFSTTDTGETCGSHGPVAALQAGQPGQEVPNVEFSWSVPVTGMVEQHKETLDFFAATKCAPARLGGPHLASQDVQFEREEPVSQRGPRPYRQTGDFPPGGEQSPTLDDPAAAGIGAASVGVAALRRTQPRDRRRCGARAEAAFRQRQRRNRIDSVGSEAASSRRQGRCFGLASVAGRASASGAERVPASAVPPAERSPASARAWEVRSPCLAPRLCSSRP